MDEGALGVDLLSEEAQCGTPLGKAPLLGTLEDMLRKAPYTDISLHTNPFTSEGNLESGEECRIPGTLNDDGGRPPLLGTPKDMFGKALEWVSVAIGAPLLGNMEGTLF
jgi:hypothetical protein